MAALGLRCCAQVFSSCGEHRLLSDGACGLLNCGAGVSCCGAGAVARVGFSGCDVQALGPLHSICLNLNYEKF